MHPDTPYWFALTYSSGLNHADIHELVRRWRTGEERPVAELFQADQKTCEVLGITGQHQAAISRAEEGLEEAREAVEQCDLAGLAVVISGDPDYPASLLNTLGRVHPPMLFCAGDTSLFAQPSVSMIGARRARPESLEFTREVAGALGEARVCVVSGFAEGVDRCASAAALEAGGDTILFLAQGLLTFGRADELLGSYLDGGHLLAVSVCKPREQWLAMRAMQRNGLITAASNETVVAQCGLTGGTWEASRTALKQKKRVWLRADDDPDLGHGALEKLGARVVQWPQAGTEWIGALVELAAQQAHKPGAQLGGWTKPKALKLLRRGSASEIYDATGISGGLLKRIVEGRECVRLRRIEDLKRISGVGAAAVIEVAQAFGLSVSIGQQEQLSLFPDPEENTAHVSRVPRAGSLPEPSLSEEMRKDILEFAVGSGKPSPAKPKRKKRNAGKP
jgi:DNA processing protein